MKSITIDPSEGKVTVIGNANPIKMVKVLQKMGKNAQLWSFDGAPAQGKSGSHDCFESDCCDHDSDEEESESISWEHPKLKALHTQETNKKNLRWKQLFGFGTKNGMANKGSSSSLPPPITRHYPPMSWNQPVTNAGWYNYCGRNQSVLATYRQLSSRLLTKYNPMINYSSYEDNYRRTI